MALQDKYAELLQTANSEEAVELASTTSAHPSPVDLYNKDLTNNLWTELSEGYHGFIIPGASTYAVIGNSGGDLGARGYITAYDLKTGKQTWRFFVVPGDPAKGFEIFVTICHGRIPFLSGCTKSPSLSFSHPAIWGANSFWHFELT